MSGRKSILGVLLLSAFIVSAVAVSGASAEQRVYTCTESVTHQFSDSHCVTPNPAGGFGHSLITPGVETTITETNEKTAGSTTAGTITKIRGQAAGVVVEVQCTKVHGHGTMFNGASSATSNTIKTFSGCTVTAPAGKGCEVTGGTFTTKALKSTTAGQAAGKLRVEPAEGTQIATIPIKGCAGEVPPASNYPLTGKYTVDLSGATMSKTHAGCTTQNELKFAGVKAGVEGSLTMSMAEGSTPNLTAGYAITFT